VAVRAIATGRGQSSSCVLPSVGNRASTPRSAGHAEGVGSWVLGFGFSVLGFGFWVLGFGTVGADCNLPSALPGRTVGMHSALHRQADHSVRAGSLGPGKSSRPQGPVLPRNRNAGSIEPMRTAARLWSAEDFVTPGSGNHAGSHCHATLRAPCREGTLHNETRM
jgi:hypothetical protein